MTYRGRMNKKKKSILENFKLCTRKILYYFRRINLQVYLSIIFFLLINAILYSTLLHSSIISFLSSHPNLTNILGIIISSQSAILGIALVIFVIFIQIVVPKYSLRLTKLIAEDKCVLSVLMSYVLSIAFSILFLLSSEYFVDYPLVVLLIPLNWFFLNILLILPSFTYITSMLSLEVIIVSQIRNIDKEFINSLKDCQNGSSEDIWIPPAEDEFLAIEELLLSFISEKKEVHLRASLGEMYQKLIKIIDDYNSYAVALRLKNMVGRLFQKTFDVSNDLLCADLVEFMDRFIRHFKREEQEESYELFVKILMDVTSNCIRAGFIDSSQKHTTSCESLC